MDLSEAELNRIRQELQRSGYPLEHRVASICRAALDGRRGEAGGFYINREDGLFRQEEDGTLTPIERRFKEYPEWPGDNRSYSSRRLVYRDERPGPKNEPAWREIDRLLEMETFVPFQSGPEDATIALMAQALIECKHREDVMLVGFVDPDAGSKTSFPILGPLANTRLISGLAYKQPMPCQHLKRVTVGAVHNRKGAEQRKRAIEVSKGEGTDGGAQRKSQGDWHNLDENLIYKAAGSLYDYLVTEWEPWAEREVHPFLKEQGIMAMLEAAQGHQLFSLSNWMHHNLQPAWIEKFNANHVRWNMIPPLMLTLPIICVDMPLMLATVDEKGVIDSLEPTTAFIADEQVHAWPGEVKRVLWTHPYKRDRGYVGAPAVVVHVDSLMDILIELAEWMTAWHYALEDESLDTDAVTRWPLEEAILRATEHWGF